MIKPLVFSAAAAVLCLLTALPAVQGPGTAESAPLTATLQIVGTGPGGPNQNSFLELDCGSGLSLIAGGVSGVHPSSKLTHNAPKSGDPLTWRVAWRNGPTADKVTLRVICLNDDDLDASLKEAMVTAPGGGTGTVDLACDEGQAISGGYFGLAPGSQLRQNQPRVQEAPPRVAGGVVDGADFLVWRTHMGSPTRDDTFGVRVLCAFVEPGATYVRRVTVRNVASVDISCDPGDIVLSGGFSQINRGKLTASLPLQSETPDTWRVSSSRKAKITAVIYCNGFS